jgi:hypothetical protein
LPLEEWQRRTLAATSHSTTANTTQFARNASDLRAIQHTGITAASPNTDPPLRKTSFSDPRLSVDYAWNESLHTWLSAAHGSRSGGINNFPGLDPSEQSFEPEFNWTYELGLRYAAQGVLRSLAVTGYYIDWQDTQIGTRSATGRIRIHHANAPGVTTRPRDLCRTATRDMAARRVRLQPRRCAIRAEPTTGCRGYCGLADQRESNICIGPPRQPPRAKATLVVG